MREHMEMEKRIQLVGTGGLREIRKTGGTCQNPEPSSSSSRSSLHLNSAFGSFFDDQNGVFQSNGNSKTQNFGGFDDLLFGGLGKSTNQSNLFDYDSIFLNNWNGKPSTVPIYGVDDVFGGMPGSKSPASAPNNDDVFVSFASMSKQSAPNEVSCR
nr:hypothetical protein CFP56_37933 [Quercus suber]